MALLEMKTFVASPEIDSWQDLAVRFRLNFWLSTRAISANLYNDNGDGEDDDDNGEYVQSVEDGSWRGGEVVDSSTWLFASLILHISS